MKMRLTIPEKGNKFYNNGQNGGWSWCVEGYPMRDGLNVLSNCVGYACGRFNEIIGEMKYPLFCCNAENFIEVAKKYGLKVADHPTQGGIMVWQKGKTLDGYDGAGHVAIVEKVNGNKILTSESGWGCDSFWTQERTNSDGRWGMGSAYTFRGCIVNPKCPEKKPAKPKPVKVKKWYCSYITNGTMNLRKEMSTDSKILAKIPEGTKFVGNYCKGNWIRTNYKGKVGYVRMVATIKK